MKPGSVITIDRFASTTVNPDAIDEWAADHKNRAVWHIKGVTKGAWTEAGIGHHNREWEFVLPRKIKLKVESVQGKNATMSVVTDLRIDLGPRVDKAGRERWPLAGEEHGVHTPRAQKRIIAYLEKETGMRFKPHGSVGRGETSKNDFDIMVVHPSREEEEAAYQKSQEEADELWAKARRGEITEHEAMEAVFGDPPDLVTEAMDAIGFEHVSSVSFDGTPDGRSGAGFGDEQAHVIRYTNKTTGHTIEVWVPPQQLRDTLGRVINLGPRIDKQGRERWKLEEHETGVRIHLPDPALSDIAVFGYKDRNRLRRAQGAANVIAAVAKEMKFPADRITIEPVDIVLPLGGKEFSAAAVYYEGDGSISIDAETLEHVSDEYVRGIVAHEVTHDAFANTWTAVQDPIQPYKIIDLPDRPKMQTFATYMNNNVAQMQDWDGVTDYSRQYWTDESQEYNTALNETFAEISALRAMGGDWRTNVHPVWQEAHRLMFEAYEEDLARKKPTLDRLERLLQPSG